MKIGKFHADGEDRIGVFDGESVVDVSEQVTSFAELVTDPSAIDIDGPAFQVSEIEYLPPVGRANTIFCAALNYEAHAEESDIAVPEWPLVFLKLPQTLVGHEQPISYHTSVTSAIDYEAELAAVIGTPARHVTPEDALDHVAGYTILNDTSARDLQLGLEVGGDRLIDWFSGKAMEATTPVGPYVGVDDIDDPQSLQLSSRVNGETMQDESTAQMIQSVADLVSFVSSRVTLQPGDIIATGTPEGVGAFQDITLDPDDTVTIELEGIGTLENTVKSV